MSSSYEEMLGKKQALNSRAHLELDTFQYSGVLRYLYFLSGKNTDNNLNRIIRMKAVQSVTPNTVGDTRDYLTISINRRLYS